VRIERFGVVRGGSVAGLLCVCGTEGNLKLGVLGEHMQCGGGSDPRANQAHRRPPALDVPPRRDEMACGRLVSWSCSFFPAWLGGLHGQHRSS